MIVSDTVTCVSRVFSLKLASTGNHEVGHIQNVELSTPAPLKIICS